MTAGVLDNCASPALGNSSTEPPRTKAPAERPAVIEVELDFDVCLRGAVLVARSRCCKSTQNEAL